MIHKLFITILPVMVGEELLLPFLYWHQLLTTEVTHILQFVGSYLHMKIIFDQWLHL